MGSGAARVWSVTFIGVSVAHLVGHLVDVELVHVATKPLLMPLLAGWFLTATPPGRLRTVVGIGLGLSWLGDLGLMPEGESWFLVGLGAFLLAQLAYAVAFWPARGGSVLARPVLLIPYLAVLVGLLAVLWGDLGDLKVPVTVYAIVIVTMAVLATGVGVIVASGAASFVVSDSLIAVDAVAGLLELPAHGFWVMLTYLAAQAMIAWGVQQAAARPLR